MNTKLLLLFFVFSSLGHADEAMSEITNPDEIFGCWKKTIFSDQAMDAMNQFYIYDQKIQKYQWYCFFDDDAHRVMTSKDEMEVTTADIEELYSSYPVVMSYQLVSPGNILITHDQDPSQKQTWKILHLNVDMPLQSGEIILAGSVLMGLVDESGQGFVHLRVLDKTK